MREERKAENDALVNYLILKDIVVEYRDPHVELHRQMLFPEKKVAFNHPLEEGQRVTAQVAIDIVRNGMRIGNMFETDQGESFPIENIEKWFS